ncbi:MAG: transcriptional repressor [Bacteroidetes bacterium]|nr:MAG: transcriptional repressor [Bacteroidota bacterium]
MSIRNDLILRLKEAGLRATPQRIAILQALCSMKNHPTAEQVLQDVHRDHPEISLTTVYNTLEVFVEKGLVKKVKTDKDSMRYDAVTESHHHLYCHESDKIEDYFNEELTNMISAYFRDHQIKDFEVDDVKLQIIGKFKK